MAKYRKIRLKLSRMVQTHSFRTLEMEVIIFETVPSFGSEQEVGMSAAFTVGDASGLPLGGSMAGVRPRAS